MSDLPRLPLTLLALVATFSTLGTLAGPARAEPLDPRVELALSYYEPSFDTKVRLDSAVFGPGTLLDLEDDLGVEGEARELRGELAIRLGERFRLVFDHVEFQRSGERALGRSVQFGDVVYSASAELAAEAESSHTGAALRFSFVKTESADVALSLGVSQLDVAARISGRAVATAGGIPAGTVEVSEEGEASGPVPLVGLHGAFWPSDRLRIKLDARYIDIGTLIDEDKWSGTMTELGLGADYFVLPWLALGGGWTSSSIEADFDDGDSAGSVDYSFDGFRVTATLAY